MGLGDSSLSCGSRTKAVCLIAKVHIKRLKSFVFCFKETGNNATTAFHVTTITKSSAGLAGTGV